MQSIQWCDTHEDENGTFGNESVPLGNVWTALASGQSKVVDRFNSPSRFYLVVGESHAKLGASMRRNVGVLERFLLEGSQKNVALEHGVSYSTIALAAKRALAVLGCGGLPSRAPALLVLAAYASRRPSTACHARVSRVSTLEGELRVISFPRIERTLGSRFPASELAVLSALIDGYSHSEIAAQRGTSQRTIANQLAHVFARLRVSGRAALLLHLAELAVEHQEPVGRGET